MCVSIKALGATSEAKDPITPRPSPGPPDGAPTACRAARRRRRPGRKQRRGAAVIEFAVVAPVLFLLILVIFEFGRMVMAQQILTNAAREGARRAILEQSTAAQVRQTVTNYLARNSISGATVTVSPDPLAGAGFTDPVTVTCSVSYDRVSWVPAPWFLGGTTMTARSVMGAERLE